MDSLVPPAVESRAKSRNKLPFAFAPRFFVALLLGLLWLVPVWWSSRFVPAIFLWDALALAAWLLDLLQLPAPSLLEIRRVWNAPLQLADAASVTIEIRNSGRIPIDATLIDEAPVAVRDTVPTLMTHVPAASWRYERYNILPRERGDIPFGNLFLRYRTSFGFAERWAVAPLAQTVRVLPALAEARSHALYLTRSRQIEMEKRRQRQPGIGREFESLRDYRQGDEQRDVCWSATARRHHLVTRTYRSERSQTVWILIDAGRLLRAKVEQPESTLHLSKLDYAVNAALSLAQVASQFGDRVGLLAYGRSIQQLVRPARGPRHIRAWVEALARISAESTEANHARAARVLLQQQTRRALVLWITDFAETPAAPDVVQYALAMAHRHLVLFAAVAQPDLAALAATLPQSEPEMFRQAAALEIVERRDVLLRSLRENGVLAMELSAGRLASAIINEYLQVKDRNLL